MSLLIQRYPDLLFRLEERVVRVPETGCWIWTGELNRNGYGRLSVGGTRRMAHRLSYEVHAGPIPRGLVLDHRCRVRSCCNPHHLDPVTVRENTFRGEAILFGRMAGVK